MFIVANRLPNKSFNIVLQDKIINPTVANGFIRKDEKSAVDLIDELREEGHIYIGNDNFKKRRVKR